MTLLEKLRARLAAIRAEQDTIVSAATAREDGLTPEDSTNLEALDAESKKIHEDILRLESMESGRAMDSASLGRISSPAPVGQGPRISDVHDRREDDKMHGYSSLAEFARDVRNAVIQGGRETEKLRASQHWPGVQGAPTNFMNEGTGTEGGYLVPPQKTAEIYELVFAEDDLLTAVDSEQTSSNAVEMMADEDTPWSSGGIQAKWRAEAAQMTPTKPGVEPRLCRVHELYAFVPVTDELLADAPRIESRLTTKSARKIRWKAVDSLIYGSGAGQPLGWFNSAALVSVAEESAQAADTIVLANLLKMLSRLLVTDGGRPRWIANSDIIPQLGAMTLGNQPAFLPSNQPITSGMGGSLLGLPLTFSEHAKTLGDKGDIQLVDPMGYYAAIRGGIDFASSMHLWFDYATTAFRWTFRLGGQPHLSAPVTPANSNNTKSHFVVIDARAGS